jgi:hypothetical protein
MHSVELAFKLSGRLLGGAGPAFVRLGCLVRDRKSNQTEWSGARTVLNTSQSFLAGIALPRRRARAHFQGNGLEVTGAVNSTELLGCLWESVIISAWEFSVQTGLLTTERSKISQSDCVTKASQRTHFATPERKPAFAGIAYSGREGT